MKRHPEIARAYDLYSGCRVTSYMTIESSKGNKNVTKVLAYPAGLGVLPEPGGLLDQPHRLMSFFDAFQAGEAHAFSVLLKQ